MKIFGLEIRKSLQSISGSSYGGGFLGFIRESFAGAWQRNIVAESRQNLLAFSAVYACVSLIADDIAKLRVKLVERNNGIWTEVDRQSPYAPVLRKPNDYQTRVQFLTHWLVSKLLYGNTYVFKERDQRGIVTKLHILDPRRVTPLVADNGDVYYQCSADALAGINDQVTIPATALIHDRCVALFHPLMGVSPIYACGASATQGIRIQANSERFFQNMSRPSGILTAPASISDATAQRLKDQFEKGFSGEGMGRTFVAGDGLKYEAMTIPAVDAQLIEQLKWTVEDVARCFRVPLHKISGTDNPRLPNYSALNQDYYTQTLQPHMEAIEILLDEGLGLVDVPAQELGTELDLDGLLRMDPASQSDIDAKDVGSGILAPDEGRKKRNLPPVPGGAYPLIQQQNYSLPALAKRDAKDDPFATTPAPPAPAADAEKAAKAEMQRALETMMKGFENV